MRQHLGILKVEAGTDRNPSPLPNFPPPGADSPDSPAREALPQPHAALGFSHFPEPPSCWKRLQVRGCQLRVQPAILLRETHWV